MKGTLNKISLCKILYNYKFLRVANILPFKAIRACGIFYCFVNVKQLESRITIQNFIFIVTDQPQGVGSENVLLRAHNYRVESDVRRKVRPKPLMVSQVIRVLESIVTKSE